MVIERLVPQNHSRHHPRCYIRSGIITVRHDLGCPSTGGIRLVLTGDSTEGQNKEEKFLGLQLSTATTFLYSRLLILAHQPLQCAGLLKLTGRAIHDCMSTNQYLRPVYPGRLVAWSVRPSVCVTRIQALTELSFQRFQEGLRDVALSPTHLNGEAFLAYGSAPVTQHATPAAHPRPPPTSSSYSLRHVLLPVDQGKDDTTNKM